MPLVDPAAQFSDSLVQLLNREELPIPQRCDDPAFNQKHSEFNLGLVPGLVGPRRNHTHAIVHGHLLIGGIQIGIVAARFGHAGLGVVGHYELRDTLIELEGAHVSFGPL